MSKNILESLGSSERKEMLGVSEMVAYLKEKNIKFLYISEGDAERYLTENNNYYNVVSYKHNFERYFINGEFVDKFVELDFAYLVDLASIDYQARLLVFKMTTAIEHYLKIRILNLIENIEEEDGYTTVDEFLEKDFNDERRIHNSILSKVGKDNCNKIFSKYDIDKDKRLDAIPVWEFLEIITFGELVKFYRFFCEKYNLKDELKNVSILLEAVKLRNATAHNVKIFNELGEKNNNYKSSYIISLFLKGCGIGSYTRKNKLSNSRISEITCTLYLFLELVTSEQVQKNVKKELNYLFYSRIIRHQEYYTNNELLKSVYHYFDKIIGKYYKL